jgi:hypothetical protein
VKAWSRGIGRLPIAKKKKKKKKTSCKGPQRCCKEVELLAMRRGMTIAVMPGVRARELEVDRMEKLDCR